MDVSPGLAHLVCFWVGIKQDHLKTLYLIYPILVEMPQRNLLTKWISQLHNDIWSTAEKFIGISFVLGS